MSPADLILHLLNFLAPALAVAVTGTPAARLLWSKQAKASAIALHVAINFVACATVLAGGLWVFGVDGKMATYAAMVVASASCHWLMLRAWRI